MLKKIGKIILLVLIFVGGFAVGLGVKFYIDEWRAQRNVALWMDSLDPFKGDTYGGATPEETFDMYLSALKKGDLELASRYFYVTKQEGELKFLEKKVSDKELENYIDKLESARKDWTKKVSTLFDWNQYAAYEYKSIVPKTEYLEVKNPKTDIVERVAIPAGEYQEIIQFEKTNKIWKLYLL